MIRIGFGLDVHRLVEGRPLILGGKTIPHDKGLLGHSDADVLVHAVIDAVLGALALGDIGSWFPDADMTLKDADSVELLKTVLASERLAGWTLGNLDVTVICEEPKLRPHIDDMRANLAAVFARDVERISIKATTTERLGFCGKGEGIAAMANVLLENKT